MENLHPYHRATVGLWRRAHAELRPPPWTAHQVRQSCPGGGRRSAWARRQSPTVARW